VKTLEFVPGILQNTFLNIAEVLMQNLNIMLTIRNWECLKSHIIWSFMRMKP